MTVLMVLTLALICSGCTPAGPRALLKGKKYLDRGDVADAVTELKRATTLLATNANAWNYYGVALQRAGQPEDAAQAYQTALKLDQSLVEAHFNLGMLSLEQNWTDVAKAEFTTYTLRRPNDAYGWLKLGFAQLKTGENFQAERSFSTVRALSTNLLADAYNGLGLAKVQEGKARDASEFFVAALQARPDFAPAMLNQATVSQQYLHDNRAALANYQAYLTLSPRPANYAEVKAMVANLMQSDAASAVVAPAVIHTSVPPVETKPKVNVVNVTHTEPVTRPETTETTPTHAPTVASGNTTRPTAPPATTVPTTPTTTITTVPNQTVQLPPEQPIVTAPKTNPPVRPVVITPKPAPTNVVAQTQPQPVEVPMPEEQPKQGFWHRLFNNSDKPSNTAKHYHEETTPIPATNDELAGTKAPEEKPAVPKPETTPAIPRYAYASPPKPIAGDRHGAEGAFTKARLAEQDDNWPDAEQWYQAAADADPSWFEAQYNAGVIAHRLRNYSVALPRYELALAIQPESVDARYNFALALKAAGFALDSAGELKKILAANPDEVRAHLALANLCAQSLHDIPQAREHYLKVLELQPANPQANDIRLWISANSK